MDETLKGRYNTGLTPDEQSMVGSGIGGVMDIGTSIFTASQQAKDNDRYRKEDLATSEIARQDELQTQRNKNILRQKSLEQEQEIFKNNKFVEDNNLRHEMFIQQFKQKMEARNNLIKSFTSIKNEVSNNADIRNILLKSFRRK